MLPKCTHVFFVCRWWGTGREEAAWHNGHATPTVRQTFWRPLVTAVFRQGRGQFWTVLDSPVGRLCRRRSLPLPCPGSAPCGLSLRCGRLRKGARGREEAGRGPKRARSFCRHQSARVVGQACLSHAGAVGCQVVPRRSSCQAVCLASRTRVARLFFTVSSSRTLSGFVPDKSILPVFASPFFPKGPRLGTLLPE